MRALQQQFATQGKDYQAFGKLFIKGDLSANADACANTVHNAKQALLRNTDSEMKKLQLVADYEAVCKQHDRLRSPGVHLTALLKKAGAKGTEPISSQLLQGDAADEIAAYNQKVQRLSQAALDAAAFREDFTLKTKPVPDNLTVAVPVGDIKKGGVIKFGTYPQTAEGTDKTPIEWLVLDVMDNKALVISKYGLDAKAYHAPGESVTW